MEDMNYKNMLESFEKSGEQLDEATKKLEMLADKLNRYFEASKKVDDLLAMFNGMDFDGIDKNIEIMTGNYNSLVKDVCDIRKKVESIDINQNAFEKEVRELQEKFQIDLSDIRESSNHMLDKIVAMSNGTVSLLEKVDSLIVKRADIQKHIVKSEEHETDAKMIHKRYPRIISGYPEKTSSANGI